MSVHSDPGPINLDEDKSYQSSEKVKVRPIFDYMTDQNNIGEQQKIVPPMMINQRMRMRDEMKVERLLHH
ncbi:hypothetical protein Pst134EA_011258 [Puccinia striiformis f. sp. tritici]|uniref:hypothetical protein n=1 Tax=Puccinia striiformis f. sp. tritici TaxID=168172 RepID=UPI00200890DB|nr:hypothetical protein Pst134EA_011258 [Puccinia striiformis f. sp. tritici]KAH9467620.1 hypothetical protein Pst134EA_011258 [Puccinia striiformis f. sp. tritici]